ncbi:MAG TPA: 2'-5' RNA ligase family protein [Novosphingobium sp.]
MNWADALRKAHYPPERNHLPAHVTLFHALPPSAEEEIRTLLGELARLEPPMAEISGIMDLGCGTALAVESAEMLALHEHIAERLHGVLSPQDGHTPRLHITIQNKVDKAAAKALQAELRGNLRPYRFRFKGLALHAWQAGLWQNIRSYSFRG